MIEGRRTLVYIDEAHLRQDMAAGNDWRSEGKVWRVPSTTPGLHAKSNWYGANDFSNGQATILFNPKYTGKTRRFLGARGRMEQRKPKPTVIWDGSLVHQARLVQNNAKALSLEIIQLPGYRLNLNPIEGCGNG